MANVDNPRGFRAVGHLTGGGFGSFRTAKIKSGYATTIAKGDAVKYSETDGTLERLAVGDTNGCGVFMGCSYIDSSTGYTKRSAIWTGGTTVSQGDIVANVILDKDVEYLVQADGALGDGDINKNVDLLTVVDGDITGSKMELDASTAAFGTGQFRIIRIYDSPENNADEANVKVVVRFAENTDAQIDPSP